MQEKINILPLAYLTFRLNSEAYIEAVQDFLVDNTSPFSSVEVKFLS